MAGRRTSKRRAPPWLAPLVAGIVIGAGVAAGIVIGGHIPPPHAPHHPAAARPPAPHPPLSPARKPAAPVSPNHTVPAPSIPRQNPEVSQGPAVGPPPEAPPVPWQGRPRVAIIFDDAGYSMRTAREVMEIGRPVTISVLPDLPFSTAIAQEAPARGVQVILHLPVQPDNLAIPLGPGGITVDMSDDAIQKAVAADLATVPTAVGANNHMGSRGTSDPRVMQAVIEVMKARHLFFVDSLTSPHSVAARIAQQMGVATAVRAVFLDNQDEESYVRGQFHALIKIAQSRGQAVAIGHVGKVTARVLREMLPEFDEAGLQLVTVSELVR